MKKKFAYKFLTFNKEQAVFKCKFSPYKWRCLTQYNKKIDLITLQIKEYKHLYIGSSKTKYLVFSIKNYLNKKII